MGGRGDRRDNRSNNRWGGKGRNAPALTRTSSLPADMNNSNRFQVVGGRGRGRDGGRGQPAWNRQDRTQDRDRDQQQRGSQRRGGKQTPKGKNAKGGSWRKPRGNAFAALLPGGDGDSHDESEDHESTGVSPRREPARKAASPKSKSPPKEKKPKKITLEDLKNKQGTIFQAFLNNKDGRACCNALAALDQKHKSLRQQQNKEDKFVYSMFSKCVNARGDGPLLTFPLIQCLLKGKYLNTAELKRGLASYMQYYAQEELDVPRIAQYIAPVLIGCIEAKAIDCDWLRAYLENNAEFKRKDKNCQKAKSNLLVALIQEIGKLDEGNETRELFMDSDTAVEDHLVMYWELFANNTGDIEKWAADNGIEKLADLFA